VTPFHDEGWKQIARDLGYGFSSRAIWKMVRVMMAIPWLCAFEPTLARDGPTHQAM
jgi:hypothetical protein